MFATVKDGPDIPESEGLEQGVALAGAGTKSSNCVGTFSTTCCQPTGLLVLPNVSLGVKWNAAIPAVVVELVRFSLEAVVGSSSHASTTQKTSFRINTW